jgi:hypothetical protein
MENLENNPEMNHLETYDVKGVRAYSWRCSTRADSSLARKFYHRLKELAMVEQYTLFWQPSMTKKFTTGWFLRKG